MADIRKFTGYTAQDGSPHATLKLATDYSRDLKVKTALQVFKGVEIGTQFATDSEAYSMPTWLLANKDAIQAAFSQTVLTRKPRVSKPKVAPSPVVKAAIDAASTSPVTAAVDAKATKAAYLAQEAHAGIMDLVED